MSWLRRSGGDRDGDRDPGHDVELRGLLHDAVDDVEPAYRLDRIRARTSPGSVSSGATATRAATAPSTSPTPLTEERTVPENRRTWLVGAGGAVLATAVVIVTVALVGGGPDGDETSTASSEQSSAMPTPREVTPSQRPTRGGDSGGGNGSEDGEEQREVVATPTVPSYYMIGTNLGPRLVREFRQADAYGEDTAATIEAAVRTAVTERPSDPDYQTLWPEDTRVEVGGGDGEPWSVELTSPTEDLNGRPGGIDDPVAEMMRQQVVWTTQAVVQSRDPVVLAGPDGGDLLGVDAGPETAGVETETLALMNITNPVEGQTVDGDTLVADGRSSGFEATVIWELRRGGIDGEVVDEGSTTAEGWLDALYPWTVEVDVSDLEPGTYTFVARNDDPTGGAEGAGDYADSRGFVIE